MEVLLLRLTIASVGGVGVGSFLRHDGYPVHRQVGQIAGNVGVAGSYLSLMLAWTVLNARVLEATDIEVDWGCVARAADASVCRLPNPPPPAISDWFRPLWQPFFSWSFPAMLALDVVAVWIGWLLATKTTRPTPDKPEGLFE